MSPRANHVLLAAVCLAAVVAAIWLAIVPALTAVDVEQPRLNQAAPLPQGEAELTQTLRPAHNGLSAVELLAVRYEAPAGVAAAPAALTVELRDAAGCIIAAETFTTVAHNAPLTLRFAPQPRSAGQVYTLALRGTRGNALSAWAYGLDGYTGGDLQHDGVRLPGDLRFTTTYTYLWADVARDALRMVGRLGRLALPAWLVLFAPGLLLLSLAPRAAPAGSGRAARWGAALALSLALLALGWLWVGVFGLHWSLAALRVAYGLLGLVWALHWVLVVCLRRRDTKPRDANEAVSSTQPPAHILSLLILLVAGLLARLVAARDLALPQWVDGPHHFAIARLLAETGQVPPSYEPVLPIAPFLYHFGFHALAVTVHWLSGLPLEEVLLDLGQLLQGLVPLAAYAGVAALTGRPRAGLLAAAFLALVSYFPGYYLTWGRYTHLTGVLLLFPALALVWRLALPAPRAARRQDGMVGSIGLAGILAAGLLVTHYVVFVLWLAWAALAGAAALARRLVGGRLGRRSAPSPGTDANHAGAAGEPAASLLLAGLTGALLAAPWLWRLAGTLAGLAAQPQRLAAPLGYNAFPFEYFSSPLECGWLTLAGGCLVWGLLRRDRLVAFVAAWLGALAALVNLGPGNWLVNNNALAISLFVPGAIVLGWGADRWLGVALAWVAPFPTQATARPTLTSPENLRIAITSGDGRDTGNSEATEAMRTDHAPGDAAPASAEPGSSLALRLRLLAGALMLALLAGLLAYGAARGLPAQVSVVNRVTVLATPADRAALEWLEANTPAGAVFAINSWEWLNGTWAGSDAGGWIWPLTGRRTTLPPADYAYGSAGWQAEVNAWQQRLAEATAEGAAPAPQLLRAADVTHIFIGARGGPLRPEMFVDQPGYALVYTNGSAWIFAVVE